MPTEIKLWHLDGERPKPIVQDKLNLESRLENWLKHDISLISNDLLVIGQQVQTDYGGFIDLLAIDPDGNLVILELKRDKTPRDIVAQSLDYASWVQNLGHEAIVDIANAFLNEAELEQAFKAKFQTGLPEVLNERHRIYIVASSLDSATERIVKYLSETHDLDINVATFAYFKTGGRELLGQSFLLDESQVQTRAESKSKRKPPRSWEELRGIAEKNGVLELYDKAMSELRVFHDAVNRTRSNIAFVGNMPEDGYRGTVTCIFPELSSAEHGLVIMFYFDRLCQYFNISQEDVRNASGPQTKDAVAWNDDATFFFKEENLADLVTLLHTAKQKEAL